jgi:hypothetical protein
MGTYWSVEDCAWVQYDARRFTELPGQRAGDSVKPPAGSEDDPAEAVAEQLLAQHLG